MSDTNDWSDLPPLRRIATNGIELNVYEAGEGTPVVLLHGFPELAFSWRHQIRALLKAGYRVIAPNNRGYDGSDAPEDVTAYSVKTIVEDTVGVLDALGIDKAVWVGHDFGGMPAWWAGLYANDRVLGHIGLCTPYFPAGDMDMVEANRAGRGDDNYIVTFQEPGKAEAILGADVEVTLRAMMRGYGYTQEQFQAAPAEVQAIPIGIFVGEPQVFGKPLVTEEELAVYVDAYKKSGFRGALNWYRSLPRTHLEAQGIDPHLDKPGLMISVDQDVFLPPSSADGMENLIADLEKVVITDCGHWAQQERPEEVNRVMLEWLDRRFPN